MTLDYHPSARTLALESLLVLAAPYESPPVVVRHADFRGEVVQLGTIGDAQGVMIEPETGMRLGASDPRLGGVFVRY